MRVPGKARRVGSVCLEPDCDEHRPLPPSRAGNSRNHAAVKDFGSHSAYLKGQMTLQSQIWGYNKISCFYGSFGHGCKYREYMNPRRGGDMSSCFLYLAFWGMAFPDMVAKLAFADGTVSILLKCTQGPKQPKIVYLTFL